MLYVFSILFALGFSWLSSFLWADYVIYALSSGVSGDVLANPVVLDIALSSHFLLSILIAVIAVAPAARFGDAKGAILSGAALGAGVGSVVTGVSWLSGGMPPYNVMAFNLVGGAGYTALLSALTFGVTDLLLGELPAAVKDTIRRRTADRIGLPFVGLDKDDVAALPFHARLEKPVASTMVRGPAHGNLFIRQAREAAERRTPAVQH